MDSNDISFICPALGMVSGTPTVCFHIVRPSVMSILAVRDVKNLFRLGLKVWLINSAPYFIYLERGSSTQAPQGVVAITMQEVAMIWKKHLKTAISKPI